MVGKNHLHRFFSHFMSIFSKIMRLSNPVFWVSVYLHGLVLASKWSISSTLPSKCKLFPWEVFNFEILTHKNGSSASPQILNFSAFSQFIISRSSLSCLHDRLCYSLHISFTSHHGFLIWLPSTCEKNVFSNFYKLL